MIPQQPTGRPTDTFLPDINHEKIKVTYTYARQHSPVPVTLKSTGGVSVTYDAPALPTTTSDTHTNPCATTNSWVGDYMISSDSSEDLDAVSSSSWSLYSYPEEEEQRNFAGAFQKLYYYARAHGEVIIDDLADFEPQTPCDASQYDELDADFASDSSWGTVHQLGGRRSQLVWSDCGLRYLHRDFNLDFYRLAPKFASESNIEDALIMMEPGLRRIKKDTNFTTEEEESLFEEDMTYEETAFKPHVTVIQINQEVTEDETLLTDAAPVTVTVNGLCVVTPRRIGDDDCQTVGQVSDVGTTFFHVPYTVLTCNLSSFLFTSLGCQGTIIACLTNLRLSIPFSVTNRGDCYHLLSLPSS